MFSFARRALLWLAAAAVKAQDELAALGFDGRLASQKHLVSGKGNITYELTQPQYLLTSTGLLMEGQCTHRGASFAHSAQRSSVPSFSVRGDGADDFEALRVPAR